ncbi:3TM-type holin [uncultured Nitratireductor sp.]|uniref:3TM-type holin n=1 Tax=uncultured Nitratireductor sp. TaxID=520953 RepID=UPI0025D188A2|nr:3TM-type holin [uncultured Nitratireductor sp.]
MSATAIAIPIVLEVAKRVGAPMVERVLTEYLGKPTGEFAGSLAEQVIDAVQGRTAGRSTDGLQEPLDDAVLDVEANVMPDLIFAQVEQQREANRLQLAEMDKGPTWTWGWRPATMWMIAGLWLFLAIIVPMINLMLALMGASAHVVLILDMGTLLTLTGIYMGLYMGGHTVKSSIEKAAAAWGRKR